GGDFEQVDRSADLLLRFAAFCCRLGTNSLWPDFCSSSRTHNSPFTVHSSQFPPSMRIFNSNRHYRGSSHGQASTPQNARARGRRLESVEAGESGDNPTP